MNQEFQDIFRSFMKIRLHHYFFEVLQITGNFKILYKFLWTQYLKKNVYPICGYVILLNVTQEIKIDISETYHVFQ